MKYQRFTPEGCNIHEIRKYVCGKDSIPLNVSHGFFSVFSSLIHSPHIYVSLLIFVSSLLANTFLYTFYISFYSLFSPLYYSLLLSTLFSTPLYSFLCSFLLFLSFLYAFSTFLYFSLHIFYSSLLFFYFSLLFSTHFYSTLLLSTPLYSSLLLSTPLYSSLLLFTPLYFYLPFYILYSSLIITKLHGSSADYALFPNFSVFYPTTINLKENKNVEKKIKSDLWRSKTLFLAPTQNFSMSCELEMRE